MIISVSYLTHWIKASKKRLILYLRKGDEIDSHATCRIKFHFRPLKYQRLFMFEVSEEVGEQFRKKVFRDGIFTDIKLPKYNSLSSAETMDALTCPLPKLKVDGKDATGMQFN